MEDLLETVTAPETALVVVTGRAGMGRTTALTTLGAHFERAGHRVSGLRFTARGDLLPLRGGSSPDSGDLPATPGAPAEAAWTPLRPVEGAHDDPAIAERAAAAVLASLQQPGGRSLLLVDDAQWMDSDSLAVLVAVARRAAGGSVSCVCAVRTPAPDLGDAETFAAFAQLRASGAAAVVRVRPMTRKQIGHELTKIAGALPEPELITYLYEQSRGVRAAFWDTYELLQRSGWIRMVDKRAYLVPGRPLVVAPMRSRLIDAVAELGAPILATAKAAAALAPLGAAMPGLVAEALEIPAPAVTAELEVLRRQGVLHRGLDGSVWRFVVPQVANALIDCSGPHSKQHLAAKAVTAVWDGTATSHDTGYLCDRVAEAGRLVDSRRALGVLVSHSTAVSEARIESALHWLSAAVELADSRPQRVMILLLYTTICHSRGKYEDSLRGARRLLEDFSDQLSAGTAQELQMMAVCALGGLDQAGQLAELADARRRWPGGPETGFVTEALACAMLDRWAAADARLSRSQPSWASGNSTSAMLGGLFHDFAKLCTGDEGPFEKSLLERSQWPLRDVRRHRVDQINLHVAGLLLNGDAHRAGRLLVQEQVGDEELQPSNRAMAAALRGDIDLAAEVARRAVAYRSGGGFDAGYSGMYYMVVLALVARGKFATARELLTAARETKPVLAHLLDLAEAEYENLLGDPVRAAEKVRAARDHAESHGIVLGMDLVWSTMVDLALDLRDRPTAELCVTKMDRLADSVPGVRTVIHALFGRAVVFGDRAAADECLRLSRDRDQPLELARILAKLIKHGVADPTGLSEVYEILGRHGALLIRARTRSIMREHGIPVPGRQESVTENEYLLAVLMSEGLSNKQLASALRTSEKSVEGRLSRLASRTGFRSRIELSNALLNGEFAMATGDSGGG
ncbi:AAA family ATPase [Amycolatopsis sp. WQ 127309]|nr:AAA family ATPase [Amycolatopsis sp. WQ 127309]